MLCHYAECRSVVVCGHLFSDDAQGRSDHAAVHEVRFSGSHLALKLKPGTKKIAIQERDWKRRWGTKLALVKCDQENDKIFAQFLDKVAKKCQNINIKA